MQLNSFFTHLLTIFVGCYQITLENNHQKLICSSLNDFYSYKNASNIKEVQIFGRNGAREILKEFSFIKYGNLSKLNIENAINLMELGAFDALLHIEDLKFKYNHFPILKAKLFDLVATSLTITNCQVQDIEPKTFGNIRNIFITQNSIPVIRKDVFTNTATSGIQLKSNEIKIIEKEAFSNMPNLKYLDLSDNKLTNFDGGAVFGEAKKLKLLDLRKNGLTKVGRESFSSAPNLENLILASNLINKVDYETFLDLNKLEYLDLSSNFIKELHPNIFKSGNRLQLLFLNDNFLSFLSSEFLSQISNLKNISLSSNVWHCSCKEEIDSWVKQNGVVDYCQNGDQIEEKCFENDDKKCVYNVEKHNFVKKIEEKMCEVPKWSQLREFDDFQIWL